MTHFCMMSACRAESDQNKVLMFIDAFDTLIQGGDHDICTRNISQAFRSAGVDILFEAEIVRSGIMSIDPILAQHAW